MAVQRDSWPRLEYAEYRDTKDTLHMYTQIIGKLRLALKPPLTQWAHAPLLLSANGLTTGPLWVGDGSMAAELDLVLHVARFSRSDGRQLKVRLGQGDVATFYRQVGIALDELGVDVHINPMPQELLHPIPFDQDTTHATYDPEQANKLWQAMIRVGAVYERFQSGFDGKQSNVGFYWGTFDVSVTRFSGRPAPPAEGMGQIMGGAFTSELMTVTFSMGSEQARQASFLVFVYPPPQGMATARLRPSEAAYAELPGVGGVFMLPYEAVRTAEDPFSVLLEFCHSSYEAAAGLGGWDRAQLERQPPAIRKAA